MKNWPSLSLLVLGLSVAMAQAPALAPAPAPALPPLVSPEVWPDHRVTFRVRAPHATEVGLWGDWMPIPSSQTQPMTREAGGDWAITLGPLEPGAAIYTVTVDGVTTTDPVNPKVKLRARTSASLVTVPGDGSEQWEARDVPHGTLEVNWARSEILGDTRSYIVYTPPGYAAQRGRRYPVLVLLHGSNDTAAGWTDVGRANFILDNLLAAHRAAPMIVVMPWGHAVPFDGPQAENDTRFERYLLAEVLPQVEHKYRVKDGRAQRAIVGLSMGGGQALKIGLGHLDRFGAVAAFSSAIPSDAEVRFHSLFEAPESVNRKLALLWIGCGRQDAGFERNQGFADLLTRHGLRNTFYPMEGRHNFTVWRRCFAEVAPQLFGGGAAKDN
jgi:enterochelin esterase family protein